MTLLWEADPLAADNVRLALGDEMQVAESGPAAVRPPRSRTARSALLVVGPDIDLARRSTSPSSCGSAAPTSAWC